ncbi:MAG TPA: SDR family oxidoreductase [Planctomycetota bacterium]|nr:SDR family oxidoreductase [Planctomycetota bacterium]
MTSFLEEQFSLKGEVAVVTGGTGELCSAMAQGFAQAGAKVAIVGRDAAKAEKRLAAIKDAGGDAIFIAADVTKKSDVERVAAETIKKFGKLTIALNGAGTNSATPFLDISDEELQRILDTNYKSVVYGCQVFGKALIDQKQGGTIINITSMSAIRPLSRVFTYSATKAAVLNLTMNLAREWAPQGVRVNALSPGFFPAEQNRKILQPERIAKILAHTPMNRFGEAGELMGPVVFLCARKAGSFVTGCHLTVDGGFSSMEF